MNKNNENGFKVHTSLKEQNKIIYITRLKCNQKNKLWNLGIVYNIQEKSWFGDWLRKSVVVAMWSWRNYGLEHAREKERERVEVGEEEPREENVEGQKDR